MEAICLDTDFLVDFLRDKKEAVGFVANNEDTLTLCTTRVNLFELYYGAYKTGNPARIRAVDELQERWWILELSAFAVREAGKTGAFLEKNGTMIDFRDLLIGCIAKANGCVLKTNNKRHFERIQGLKIV